ncbi:MAG TPA: peptide chain release factor 1, partial [Catenuloplanes sp.]
GDDAASGGLAAVVSALQRAQVDTVLLVDDPSSTDTLWIGPAPMQVATSADELRAMGVEDPVEVRADAALLRAVAGTDAALVLVGPGEAPLPHGVGAVLRYADAGTRTS